MKQHYYITSDLTSVEQISDDLHTLGIDNTHIHIIGDDLDKLESENLPLAREIDKTDIARFSERGAFVGGVLSALFLILTTNFKPFGLEIEGPALVAITILIFGFCVWWGGIIGSYFDNYRIASFQDAIKKGQYLLMIDVKSNIENGLKSMMTSKHPEASWVGQNSTIAKPFGS